MRSSRVSVLAVTDAPSRGSGERFVKADHITGGRGAGGLGAGDPQRP